MQNNLIVEEIHQIREQLLAEAGGDLHTAMQNAHAFIRTMDWKTTQGQPRRPAGWTAPAQPLN